MDITKRKYGEVSGNEVFLFTLSNDNGMEVDITNYGGIVASLRIPDQNHEPGDVVLGFDTLDGYLGAHPYFGAIVGRFANRIANGRFTLEGKEYTLAVNNGPNHLHGGTRGFDKVVWTAAPEKTTDAVRLKLGYGSPDMEEGYPGNLLVEVAYSLNNNNELGISYRAKTDKTTHVNLTNHSYFNLNNCRGDILDHELMIDADQVTELDENQIPVGKLVEVNNTPFDFRLAKPVGEEIEAVAPGYDINYVVNDHNGELKKVAGLFHPGTGRTMEVLTTQPGVQLYTTNYVDSISGKEGITYRKHSAVCLETQHFPDTPNQQSFPTTVLHPEEEYAEVTVYRFSW